MEISEESKKIATEFSIYVITHFNMDEDKLFFCKYELVVSQKGLTINELFDRFVNKYKNELLH